MKMRALLLLTAAFGAATFCRVNAAEIQPIELIQNGGCEEVENGVPKGFWVNNAGKLSSVAAPHTDKLGAKFEAVQHEWGYSALALSGPGAISPKATYHFCVWAKGTGDVQLAVYQYSRAGFVGSKFYRPTVPLTGRWQKIEHVYKTEDPRIASAGLAIHLFGKGAVAYIDDVSFTFNPEENPGITIQEAEQVVTRKLRFQVKGRNAETELFVGGKRVELINGAGAVEISEGLVPVALKAEAKGAGPGVSVKILDQPETDGRWRVGTKEQGNWLSADFNDGAWLLAAVGPDGYMWGKDPTSRKCFFRQVVLWNNTHYGPDRCIVPPVREWGFPRGGLETLTLALYSPLPYRLDDYEFALDVPEEFRLLGKTDYEPRHSDNNRPQKILTETVNHGGRKYTRYRMFHKSAQVRPDRTQYSLLPVKMETGPQWETSRFYFRRSARGNFTELQQSIPVKTVPPVNGRMPKKIMISFYAPLGFSTLSKEHLEAAVKQAVRAGCGHFTIAYYPGWGQLWRDYMKLFHDTVVEAGGHVTLWPSSNFPLCGTHQRGHTQGYLYEWIKQTPEARPRIYQDSLEHSSDPMGYCPEYMATEGAEKFKELVKKEYEVMLAFLPGPELIFNDDERHFLPKSGGEGAGCFCDLCKRAFREFANVPESEELTDELLVTKYRRKWLQFRAYQEGRVHGLIKEVCHELGRPYMVYSWAGSKDLFKACRGNIDIAFPGMPGNSVADSYFQKSLDGYAAFMREEAGFKQVMGQRFIFPHKINAKDGWKRMQSYSHDGFIHPQSWKTQILRIAASLRGGVDLQSYNEFSGGISYYVGEATRIISEFEDLFWDGERADELASSDQIEYPNLLVLKLGHHRLVLLFNEQKGPLSVVLENKDVRPGLTASIYGTGSKTDRPEKMEVTVPPEDCAVVRIGGLNGQ